jgi:hypothetical protein
MKLVNGIAAAVFAFGFASLPLAAQSEREMRDRVQIEELMWRYVRALDSGNADAYAAMYTPDGQFGTGANAAKGTVALRKLVADFEQRSGGQSQGCDPRSHVSHEHRPQHHLYR